MCSNFYVPDALRSCGVLNFGTIEYHWEELWRVLLTLLDFLVHKLDESRRRTKEVEDLTGEVCNDSLL